MISKGVLAVADGLLALQKEVAGQRERLFNRILERDQMICVDSWRLRHKYLGLFAAKECAVYDVNTKVLARKLADKLAAEGLPPDEVQRRLEELAAKRHDVWLAHVQHRNQIVENGHGWRLDKHWFERLHYFYAECVRLIHPDIFPAVGAELRDEMAKARDAYAGRDLIYLALLPEMLQGMKLPQYNLWAMTESELQAELARLAAKLQEIETEVSGLKCEHPYYLQELLDDEAACAEYAGTLDELLAYLRAKLPEDGGA